MKPIKRDGLWHSSTTVHLTEETALVALTHPNPQALQVIEQICPEYLAIAYKQDLANFPTDTRNIITYLVA